MKQTKDDIIDLADLFIRTRGFNAFSYADIAGAMQFRKAAIHHHFPSKSDLGIKIMDNELRNIFDSRIRWARLPGNEQLKKIVETFFRRSRKDQICLTGSLTPEYRTFADEMQEKVREMCKGILEWVTVILEKGRREKNLHFEGTPGDRALIVLSVLLSSLLLSGVLGTEIFDRMVNQMLMDIGAGFRVDDMQEEIPGHLID